MRGGIAVHYASSTIEEDARMSVRISQLTKWFTPPVVVPAVIALMVVSFSLYRYFTLQPV